MERDDVADAHGESGGFWTHLSIPGFGKIHFLPHSSYRPQPQIYKVVFAISTPSSDPNAVSLSLELVARAVNLYTESGVAMEQLRFVAVVYAAATPIALNDRQHEAVFGMRNPDIHLVAELGDAGVDVAVCGQSVALHNYLFDWIDETVTIALSAVTTVSALQEKGYALVQS